MSYLLNADELAAALAGSGTTLLLVGCLSLTSTPIGPPSSSATSSRAVNCD